MSCGRPHATPCSEVLERLYAFIDSELDTATAEDVREHLEECGPCLAQASVERLVKALVARSCSCEPAPERVRTEVVQSIRFSYREYRFRLE